jgi:hypothetical protein
MYIGLYGFVGMFAQYVAVPFLSGKLKLHDTTIGQSGIQVLDYMFCPFFCPFLSRIQVLNRVGHIPENVNF